MSSFGIFFRIMNLELSVMLMLIADTMGSEPQTNLVVVSTKWPRAFQAKGILIRGLSPEVSTGGIITKILKLSLVSDESSESSTF